MIVYDFDFMGTFKSPTEANPVLSIDSDTLLPISFASQLFKTVPRRCSKVLRGNGLVKSIEFPTSYGPKNCRTRFCSTFSSPSFKNVFGAPVGE